METGQFDWRRGIRERERGIASAEAGASPTWRDHAEASVRRVAARLDEFTSDEVWEDLARNGVRMEASGKALGPVMRAAAREGVCEPTDRFKLTRQASRHRAPIRIHKSLVRASDKEAV